MSKFSDQEAQFKKRARRRLIGAIILVVLAVAVLPFVLDNEPQPVNENISIQIPAQTPATSAPPQEAPPAPPPATPPPEAKPALPEPPAVLPEKPETLAKPPEIAEKPKEQQATEKAAQPRAEVAEKAPADEFVVQLGAFSNPANAKQAQQKLKSAGIKSYTETIQSGGSKTIRVRAGPFTTREQAEKIRDKLKAMGYSGMVAAK